MFQILKRLTAKSTANHTVVPVELLPLDDKSTSDVLSKITAMLGDIKNDPFIINANGNITEQRCDVLLNQLTREAAYARVNALPSWLDTVGSLPSVMDCVCEINETTEAARYSVTYWVVWYNDGSAQAYQPIQNKGLLRTGREIIRLNDPAEPMPERVTRAMKITVGVSLIDNFLRGFRWELFVAPI